MQQKPEEVKIFSQINENEDLIDVRLHRNFALFGKVKDVARQYGINYNKVDNGILFTAPKTRMQMFVEKLHFAQKEYLEIE